MYPLISGGSYQLDAAILVTRLDFGLYLRTLFHSALFKGLRSNQPSISHSQYWRQELNLLLRYIRPLLNRLASPVFHYSLYFSIRVVLYPKSCQPFVESKTQVELMPIFALELHSYYI